MTAAVSAHAHPDPESFSHEAVFYSGPGGFVAEVTPFVREGIDNGEPMLVMVTEDKIELLKSELGAAAGSVTFMDMAEEGRNPGRIISAWNDYAAGYLADGRLLRGVGEPIWAGRGPDEMIECQLHESLLNLAFCDADGFRLLCPYDTDALPADVIDEARRSHPLILEAEGLLKSGPYRGLANCATATEALPTPRSASEEMGFQQTNLPACAGS